MQSAAVVRAAGSAHREQGELRAGAEDRLCVFHGQNIVRILQQRGAFFAEPAADRFLARGGERKTGVQQRPERFPETGRKQRRRSFLQIPGAAVFTAEAECFRAAHRRNHRRSAGSKALGTGHCPGQRQLQYEIGPVLQRHVRAGPFVQQSRFPPLNETAAHHGGNVGRLPFRLFQMKPVAAVKRIIFADYPENMHKT